MPKGSEARDYVTENLSGTLTKALTELCQVKPRQPVKWLAEWLLENNPNKPTVDQLVIEVAPPAPKAAPKKKKADMAIVAQLRELFDRIDVDKSGAVTISEFTAVDLVPLGISLPNLPIAQCTIFSKIDRDGDGQVTWQEFKKGLLEDAAHICYDARISLYRKIYNDADKNKNQNVSTMELVRALKQNEQLLTALFSTEVPSVMDMFKKLDKDKSGSVTWDEFAKNVEQAFAPKQPPQHTKILASRAPPPLEAPPDAPPPPPPPPLKKK